MPDPNDLLDIYFASWSPGEPAPCVHFQGAVYQQFRGCDTVEKLRPVVDQLAHQRTDVKILTGAPYDHPWYIVIGQAPASRRASSEDVLTTMREDFGRVRWVHPQDLRRHVLRRVRVCSESLLHQLCTQLADQGRGRVRGDDQDYGFRID